jgi:hypothetical protein
VSEREERREAKVGTEEVGSSNERKKNKKAYKKLL